MKMPKITKLLSVALALAVTTSGVLAAGTQTQNQTKSVTANYELNLDTYFDIELKTAPTKSEVSFTEDYTVATIDNTLQGSYEVISNTNTKDIYLYGECQAGTKLPALFGDIGSLNIVFTNTKTVPNDAAVTSAKGANPTTKENPNTIAFPLTITSKHFETPSDDYLAEEFKNDNVHYQIANGRHTIDCKISGTALPGTFSTMDTDGLYKATLTLSDTEL